MDDDEVRDLSGQLDPQLLRAQWQDQMISSANYDFEIEAEIEKKLEKYGTDSFQDPLMAESGLLSGDLFLTGHRVDNYDQSSPEYSQC